MSQVGRRPSEGVLRKVARGACLTLVIVAAVSLGLLLWGLLRDSNERGEAWTRVREDAQRRYGVEAITSSYESEGRGEDRVVQDAVLRLAGCRFEETSPAQDARTTRGVAGSVYRFLPQEDGSPRMIVYLYTDPSLLTADQEPEREGCASGRASYKATFSYTARELEGTS